MFQNVTKYLKLGLKFTKCSPIINLNIDRGCNVLGLDSLIGFFLSLLEIEMVVLILLNAILIFSFLNSHTKINE